MTLKSSISRLEVITGSLSSENQQGWQLGIACVGPAPTFLWDDEFAGQGQRHDGMLAHEGRQAPCKRKGSPA
jgi:hypothetical protein